MDPEQQKQLINQLMR